MTGMEEGRMRSGRVMERERERVERSGSAKGLRSQWVEVKGMMKGGSGDEGDWWWM